MPRRRVTTTRYRDVADGMAGFVAGQPLGQRDRQADDRHGSLGRHREMVVADGRLRRLRGLRAVEAQDADGRRLAARGAADHGGARQEGRRPRRADREDRQGRVHPRQPERERRGLDRDRLPLRQTSVAERSERMGLAWRQPSRGLNRQRPLTKENRTRDPVTSPPLPVPDRIARGQLSPKSWPQLFWAMCEMDHTSWQPDGPRFRSPDGASQFNIRGWQGRWRQYCADGLVLYGPDRCGPVAYPATWLCRPAGPPAAPAPRRLVIC